MAKLFLIRRNLETFSGPMTVVEMREAHRRMQFGMSDEVAGHCGPWVSFDNLTSLKRYYPEVAKIVSEEILPGWGISENTEARLVAASGNKKLPISNSRSMNLALAFLLIAFLAFVAAVYMATANGRMSSKPNVPESDASPQDVQGFIERGEFFAFEEYMRRQLENIVKSISEDRQLETVWLPYLRFYAFNHEGAIAGVSGKILRGQLAGAAPSDCSLKQWRKQWRSSYKLWNQVLIDRKLIRAHWARMLAWDPHWIRRRDNKGWIGNQNYYSACMVMADRALDELAADTSLVSSSADWARMGFTAIKSRIAWILNSARGIQDADPMVIDNNNALSIWTCMEQARDLKTLSRCKEGLVESTPEDAFVSYTEERFIWNSLRIAMRGGSSLNADMINHLDKMAAKASRADFYTRFDYRAEQRLLRALARTTPGEGAIDRIVEKLNSDFPDVRIMY